MFGMFSVPWDFFHIGLLVVVIMIMITGMVICVSVIGVCCFHWLENLEENSTRGRDERRRQNNSNQNSCGYDTQNQSVHVVVLPEKLKGGITMDPCQLREHFHRMDDDVSHRRFLFEERAEAHQNQIGIISHPHPPQPQPPDDGPPPPYDMLYPANPAVSSNINTVTK